ncbi:alpha/beta hydrolase [Zafaria cholistanensis]|uniref:Alpha/beta hydrolase n=1 Tax=Zafaria cholistanensis TaxID=1682741 RepID=A0A5A7NP39_9MICC|nr:alpha/beta fold hydrolase [Zafaria cholistanensis]GER22615.1 alpha/beta hydrolase [Zafaria cholistanensis]
MGLQEHLLRGIRARRVPTDRLIANVLERGGDDPDGMPVVFVHGNLSSSLVWQDAMLALPGPCRALAVDLRGFGGSDTAPVDATRGVRDFSDDLAEVLLALGVEAPHLVGWDLGGGVAMQYVLDHAVSTLSLVAPVSPYGFGGTAGPEGRRLTEDDAGTGAGGVNPDFVARLAAGDHTEEAPTSPRAVYRTLYVHAGFSSGREDAWLEAMLSTATGEANYPGDSRPSEHWPGFAPGNRGVLNALAPAHFNVSPIVEVEPKPPILWIHGDSDAVVSDASLLDINQLGRLGVAEGWPGEEEAPPQPMVAQTRAVLSRYRERGGAVREVLLPGCGHSPHLEFPEDFLVALLFHLGLH